jgi:hypothetical protein
MREARVSAKDDIGKIGKLASGRSSPADPEPRRGGYRDGDVSQYVNADPSV